MPNCRGSGRSPPPSCLADHLLVGEVAAVGFRGVAKVRRADADEAKRGAVAGGLEQLARRLEQAGANWVGGRPERGAGQEPESQSFSFSVMLRPASPAAFRRRETFSASRQRIGSRSSKVLRSCRTWSRPRRSSCRVGRDPPVVLAAGEPGQAVASRPRASNRAWGRTSRRWLISVTPALARRAWAAAPIPGMIETGRSARKAAASSRPMIEKPRGFSRSEAILARNLFGAARSKR